MSGLFTSLSSTARALSAQQTGLDIVGQNIANANTPGYEALDIQPFSDVMDQTRLSMARTNVAHLGGLESDAGDAIKVSSTDSWDVTHSGNSVSVEQEMMKADEVNRAFSLDVSIMRAFHSLMMASVRSSS